MLASLQTGTKGHKASKVAQRPLNIVLAVNSFLPQIGGKEMVVHYLAQSLTELGHRVRVFLVGGFWPNRHMRYPYAVHRWPVLSRRSKDWSGITALRMETALSKTDIIHAHVTYPMGYWAVQARSSSGLPVVITPHGHDIHVIPEVGHGMRLNPNRAGKVEVAVKNADCLTAISRSVEKSIVEAGGGAARIRNIPNGIDLKRFRGPGAVGVRDRYGIPDSAKIVLSVGSYVPRRGYEYLVQAMRSVLVDVPNAYLVIVGRATDRLQGLIKDLHLGPSVLLAGQITPPVIDSDQPDLIAGFYRIADVYVTSGMSDGAEGLSLALLDGMAAGLPVVATRISGNEDIVSDGETGVLVTPKDAQSMAVALTSMLRDPVLAGKMGEQGNRAVQRYGWSEIARKYVDLYREFV